MKATTLRLFATMITLAAITIAITIPAHAQRRSTQSRTETKAPEKSRNIERTVQKKSTFKDNDRVQRSKVDSNLKSTRSTSNKSTATSRGSNTSSRNTSAKYSGSRKSSPSSSRTINSAHQQSRKTQTVQGRSSSPSSSNKGRSTYSNGRTINSELNRNSSRTPSKRQYSSSKSSIKSNRETARRSTGTTTSTSRNFYQVDKSDKRYATNNNYKGSKNYWSGKQRSYSNNNYKSGHSKHYNYNSHKHWNSGWEHYRWNYNSWRDYYHGYQFNSYTQHRYYYHHKQYGHVIRRFDYRPQIFVHNHHNYYSYDGHFFRYNRGVGYVLVDIPFGLSFEYLPNNYERVNINGYTYFRVGNMFFEWANYGFRLVHYPERYYAYNDDSCTHGYQFNDDYYYDDNY